MTEANGDRIKNYLEFQLKLLPLFLILLGWGIRVERFMAAGPRYTSEMAAVDQAQIEKEITGEVSRQLSGLRVQIQQLQLSLVEVRVNQAQQIKELSSLIADLRSQGSRGP